MSGKIIGIFIVASGLIAGVAIYYLQVFGFYDEVNADDLEIKLTLLATGTPDIILAENVQAIDADSSPLRFRACFTTPHDHAMLTETYVVYEKPVPLIGPSWFDCFDAVEIGIALENDLGIAYLSQASIQDGIDRVVAILDDGRGFVWHQLNEKYSD